MVVGNNDEAARAQLAGGSRTERLRFRLNATATRTSRREGVNIVLRPIPDMPPSLEMQLVEPAIMAAFRPREGMVIVSGATGSGKSTLIAGISPLPRRYLRQRLVLSLRSIFQGGDWCSRSVAQWTPLRRCWISGS